MESNFFNDKEALLDDVLERMSIIKGADAQYLMRLNLEQLSWQTEGEYFLLVRSNGHSTIYRSMSAIYTIEEVEEIAFIVSVCIGTVNAVTIFKTDKN